MKDGETPLNSEGAGRVLRRSEKWIVLQRKKPGGPPFYKVGGRFEYYASELQEWLRAQRQTT